jgi:hypothetical protein
VGNELGLLLGEAREHTGRCTRRLRWGVELDSAQDNTGDTGSYTRKTARAALGEALGATSWATLRDNTGRKTRSCTGQNTESSTRNNTGMHGPPLGLALARAE